MPGDSDAAWEIIACDHAGIYAICPHGRRHIPSITVNTTLKMIFFP
jgi:hypothetical protein